MTLRFQALPHRQHPAPFHSPQAPDPATAPAADADDHRSEHHSAAEATARLSVTLPRTLYRRFRLHALEQDLTVSALIARMIRAELD